MTCECGAPTYRTRHGVVRCSQCDEVPDSCVCPAAKPRLYVGQRVVVDSAAVGERIGVIRRFKWNEDGDNLVVVDLDPLPGRPAVPASQMGWVFDERQVTPLSSR